MCIKFVQYVHVCVTKLVSHVHHCMYDSVILFYTKRIGVNGSGYALEKRVPML